ncbi:MAG: hypothetical protein CL678_07415 [Bdellovibrionaceae bacterium]|nr:hypothetical protein [Pseudobdellovibrionaceae bacterium]|tara:strand:- start:5914 stop:7326 length:1413 start_codon:yes stop_codon:yes gene_type:complete
MNKLHNFEVTENQIVHSPFHPEYINIGDGMTAKILVDNEFIFAQIIKYSPFGIELFIETDKKFMEGEEVSLLLNIAGDEIEYKGLVVNQSKESGEKNYLAIRTFIEKSTQYDGKDRRQVRRWECNAEFLPTGTAPNPLKYNDHIVFRVEDLSSKGVRLITSMRNKLIATGQRLDLSISLPTIGSVLCSILIKNLDTTVRSGKEYLVIGGEYLSPSNDFYTAVSEYLLNFGKNVSVESLRKQGFPIKNVSKWLDFSYAKTVEEYEKVLHLRMENFKTNGKLPPTAKPQDCGDKYDSKSQILTVKKDGNIISSARIGLPNNFEDSYYNQFLDLKTIIPDIQDIIELSSLCANPEFRGADIFTNMIAHSALVAIKNGRTYIIGGTSGYLVNFYVSAGAKRTGLKYVNPRFPQLESEILIMNIKSLSLGYGIGIKRWNQIYPSLVKYMIQKKLIQPTPLQNMKINFYEKMGKFI